MNTFFKTYLGILGFLTAIVTFILILIIVSSLASSKKSFFSYYTGDENSENKVAILKINGPIISEPVNLFNFGKFSESKAIYPSLINNYLKELKDIQISGIIVSINSPGGSVTAGLSIYDTMQFISCDVSTICVGQAASMGALLLGGGANGKRFALPHSRIMVHQPSAGFQGQATDIDIHAKEVLELKHRLNKIMAKHTGQKVAKIEKDLERDNFMSSPEAVDYGLIDSVLSQRKK